VGKRQKKGGGKKEKINNTNLSINYKLYHISIPGKDTKKRKGEKKRMPPPRRV